MRQLLLALPLAVSSLVAQQALACDGYMESRPMIAVTTRADVIVAVKDAEAALESGDAKQALERANDAAALATQVRNVGAELTDRMETVKHAAIVFDNGGHFILPGSFSVSTSTTEQQRFAHVTMSTKALHALAKKQQKVGLAAEASLVGDVLNARPAERSALIAKLQKFDDENGLVLPQSLAVVAAFSEDAQRARQARELCEARSVYASVCAVSTKTAMLTPAR